MSELTRAWALWMAAIACELCASSCLKASQGFTRPRFVALIIAGVVLHRAT